MFPEFPRCFLCLSSQDLSYISAHEFRLIHGQLSSQSFQRLPWLAPYTHQTPKHPPHPHPFFSILLPLHSVFGDTCSSTAFFSPSVFISSLTLPSSQLHARRVQSLALLSCFPARAKPSRVLKARHHGWGPQRAHQRYGCILYSLLPPTPRDPSADAPKASIIHKHFENPSQLSHHLPWHLVTSLQVWFLL